MKVHSVILLESNSAILSQLKDALDESKDFHVIYAGEDGDEGIKQILQFLSKILYKFFGKQLLKFKIISFFYSLFTIKCILIC